MFLAHARAIVWAQFRSLINFYSRGNTGMLVFTLAMSAMWYGMLAFGGVTASMAASDPRGWFRRAGGGYLAYSKTFGATPWRTCQALLWR